MGRVVILFKRLTCPMVPPPHVRLDFEVGWRFLELEHAPTRRINVSLLFKNGQIYFDI